MLNNFLVTCVVVYFLIALEMKMDHVIAQEIKNPANHRRHKIVKATMFHARTKRQLSSTRHSKGLHHLEVTIKINISNEEYILDLILNMDLISEDHVISYQEGGKTVQHKPTIEELDICQYSGVVRDKPNSWAAVSTCRGVRGVLYDGQRMRHIEPAEDGEITSNHFVYDRCDVNITHKCGSDDAGANVTNNTNYDPHQDPQHNTNSTRPARHKRDASGNTDLRGHYRSTYLSRYVELVLVADHKFYRTHGEDIHKVYNIMRDVTNLINSLYSPLNIYITLVGAVVWNEGDEIRLSRDSVQTLAKFEEYRRTRLNIKNDNAHLITFQPFDGGVVGKGQENVMCTYYSSAGIASYDHDSTIDSLAATIAHEMGHNFGMGHDDDPTCKCPDKYCIMSGTLTEMMPTHWSSCSLRSLRRAFDRGAEYCLRNKPKRLFPYPTCGNGFVEYGEECDCGQLATRAGRNACLSCCNPRTCRFQRNATCASGECCDLTTCRVKTAGTVCRGAHKECDLPEHCTGQSEFCPADVFKMDSTPCGKHQEAYCAGGSCKSQSTQCRMLWGPTAYSSHPKCYKLNGKGKKGKKKEGNVNGNCGYDRETDKYELCSSEDELCGRLQCQTFENLRFGYEKYANLGTQLVTNNNGNLFQCRTAHIDLGMSDVDPGLVPDGAKCGDNKMCLKQRCRPIAEIQAKIAVCPSDCNGRGICNSKGHCHCYPGFAPPECAVPGPGGSYDSGPTTKLKETHPKSPGDTTKPKDPRDDGPTNITPTPRTKRPDDTFKPIDPKHDGPTNVTPIPHPKAPGDTTKPKDPRADGPSNVKPTPRTKKLDDTIKPKVPRVNDPTNIKPGPLPKGSDDTDSNDTNNVGPTHVTSVPPPDGTVNTGSKDNEEILTNSRAQTKLMVAIYVVFLGILPLILLVLFVIYFKKLKDFCCCNKSRILSLGCLNRRRYNNSISSFTKFPRIAVDASSHRIFFIYNNTASNEHVSPVSSEDLIKNRNRNINTNIIDINFTEYHSSPVNTSNSCKVVNNDPPVKKIIRKMSRENIMNNIKRDPETAALIETVKSNNKLPHIHPVRPKPSPKTLSKANKLNMVASVEFNQGLSSTDTITVKERIRRYNLGN